MSNVTINDIAKRAGVAKSTVSRVLNGGVNVSEETRSLIQKTIDEMNYRPSAVARGLSTNASNVIGVIVPDSASLFWGQVLEGISEIAEKNGVTVLFCSSNNSWQRELQALQKMHGQRIEGLLITPSVDYDTPDQRRKFLQSLDELGCPVVFIDRIIKTARWDGVYFDNYNGAYIATEALSQMGCTKIGAIISDIALQLGSQRKDGFLQALQDAELDMQESCTYFSNYKISLQDSYHLAKQWIENKTVPEAIFLSNGMIANGFFKALLEHGLLPGRDIVCMGFDYVEVLDILNLDYSYLDRDAVNMGRIAAKMLFEQSEGGRREHIIPAKLILSERSKNRMNE